MLNLTRRTEYGLMAILYMIDKADDTLASAKEISESYNIPREILAKVLQRLAGNNVIIAVKGASGGYKLNKPVNEISLTSFIEAVEGPIGIVDCIQDKGQRCDPIKNCNIKHSMRNVNKKILQLMDGITIEDFYYQR